VRETHCSQPLVTCRSTSVLWNLNSWHKYTLSAFLGGDPFEFEPPNTGRGGRLHLCWGVLLQGLDLCEREREREGEKEGGRKGGREGGRERGLKWGHSLMSWWCWHYIEEWVCTAIGRSHVCTPDTRPELVCRLLLEKKKNKRKNDYSMTRTRQSSHTHKHSSFDTP